MMSETYELLEESVQIQLVNLNDLDVNTKEGREALQKATKLVELLITSDKDYDDRVDKQERRKIEEKRNEAMAAAERDKQKLTFGRVGLELAKVGLPVLGSAVMFFLGIGFYYGIEKDGRVTSDGCRMVLRQIPMIFKR